MRDTQESFGGNHRDGFSRRIDTKDIDPNFSFVLHDERDADKNAIEGEAQWVKFQHEGKSVEGKFYSPARADNDTLLLFEPGMPGDAVGWMEEKHVPALLKAGYSVMVLRHMGTRTNTEKANTYIHCPERLENGREQGTDVLGDGDEHDVLEMADEPAIAMNILGKKFKTIKLIGHSAGTPYLIHSLEKVEPDVKKKITNLVSLSGHIGGIDALTPNFPPFRDYLTYCSQHIAIGDIDRNFEAFKRVFDDVYRQGVPGDIMVTQVHCPGDEYIPESAAKKFQEFLGRGLNIVDTTQTDPEFHDLKNLRPETLLRLLDMHHPKRMHTTTVKERNPK